jgi:UDP-glucose 4-epimerase
VAKELAINGYDVIILDNLSTGHREAVESVTQILKRQGKCGKVELVVGNCGDKKILANIFGKFPINAVVYLAAYSQVGESMINPGKYFENNVVQAISLLEGMVQAGIKQLVFSSTAAVYGEPLHIPIYEEHPVKPTNVYGSSKLMVEELLRWYERIHGLKYISLRYFNAAGADITGMIGENHEPETHLIPLVIQKVLGLRESLAVFGNDYPTPDGTCLRDYIHVSDLAQAHILALEALNRGADSAVYNLGNGKAYSVKEVIDMVAEVTGSSIDYKIEGRRAGDPAVLLASSAKIKNELGWSPHYPELKDIIESAWKWHHLY